MKRALIYISLLWILTAIFSCDIHKKSQKSKVDTNLTEETETKTFRKGDTVHYEVPKITLKDTVIYTYSRQGTVLKTVYDASGKVSDIDCVASAIELYEKKRTELEQTEKSKEKEKTESLSDRFILYIIGGIVILGMFAFLLMFMYVRKNTKIVTNVLENLKI